MFFLISAVINQVRYIVLLFANQSIRFSLNLQLLSNSKSLHMTNIFFYKELNILYYLHYKKRSGIPLSFSTFWVAITVRSHSCYCLTSGLIFGEWCYSPIAWFSQLTCLTSLYTAQFFLICSGTGSIPYWRKHQTASNPLR